MDNTKNSLQAFADFLALMDEYRAPYKAAAENAWYAYTLYRTTEILRLWHEIEEYYLAALYPCEYGYPAPHALN